VDSTEGDLDAGGLHGGHFSGLDSARTPGLHIGDGTPRAFTCARLPADLICFLLEKTTNYFYIRTTADSGACE
jgi:hypothetical protein